MKESGRGEKEREWVRLHQYAVLAPLDAASTTRATPTANKSGKLCAANARKICAGMTPCHMITQDLIIPVNNHVMTHKNSQLKFVISVLFILLS
jgi:hypothetical protein